MEFSNCNAYTQTRSPPIRKGDKFWIVRSKAEKTKFSAFSFTRKILEKRTRSSRISFAKPFRVPGRRSSVRVSGIIFLISLPRHSLNNYNRRRALFTPANNWFQFHTRSHSFQFCIPRYIANRCSVFSEQICKHSFAKITRQASVGE